jgi:pyruvate/2-oxoglutarate dehydrogenase complex dihydrolipoamide dehydrogenase (E3) component
LFFILFLPILLFEKFLEMKEYDHVIIGTGQATGTLLGSLIFAGESIAVIEGGKVGGSCINYGCTPTKTLVASARAIHMASRGEEFGFSAGPLKLNYSRVRERMNTIRNKSSDGLKDWMESSDNVTLMHGWATFLASHIIEAGGEKISGRKIYINTGTRPAVPAIEGLDTVPWMDSAGLLDLQTRPDHLLIVGGGYVGMEFAQIYRRFGSEVTVIQHNAQIMPREDADVSEAIKQFLEDEGIRTRCRTRAVSVSRENKKIRLVVDFEGNREIISGTHLLIAAGRQPNSDRLNSEAAGIAVNERGYIEVDDYCRTNVEGIFALGDVNGKGAFTHTSVNDAEIVLDYLFGPGKRKISDRIQVYALFTDPPLGRVGMTEKEALADGIRILKAVRPMSRISRAKEMSETNGFAKVIVDAETDLILGVSILGPGGDEIINMFAAIMHSKIPCREYSRVVLVHPTVSELMPFVLEGLKEVAPEDHKPRQNYQAQ